MTAHSDGARETRRLKVNGVMQELTAAPGTPLLQVLRDNLGLTGTKEACSRGECGACTVLLDGKPILSCIALVDDTQGDITTIEALADEFADLRAAFADCAGFQCGFCTPGQIVRAAALLREDWPVSPETADAFVRQRMSGNICRCTGYGGIVDAVLRTKLARGTSR
jgi:aerobic-type carbon monoxide dehydrogenase small subunit (CoxS/CutS family)